MTDSATKDFQIVSLLQDQEFDHKNIWINEALFGFKHLENSFLGNRENMSALEIGSGAGILLSILKERYPNISFDGVEPFADGFSKLQEINTFVKKQGISIHNVPYEKFSPQKKYDFIFCVNVFEHVNDWQHFLSSVDSWLKTGGKCLILCPNYTFPYEPHFRIPIILNKAVTFKFFKSYISRFENEYMIQGLWNSLSFVKKRAVKKFILSKTTLQIKDKNDILEAIVKRIGTDPEFRKRQKLIGFLGHLMFKLKLISLFKLLPNLSPYMFLELTQQSQSLKN